MISNFRHVGIVVKDIEKALFFYETILGLKLIKKTDENSGYIDEILQLKDSKLTTWKFELPDGKIIELLHFKNNSGKINLLKPNNIGITHFALSIERLDELYGRLQENNVEILSEPKISPDGHAKIMFCRDLETNLIELVENF